MKILTLLAFILLSFNLQANWPSPKEILELANKSPLYVRQHAKDEWLQLFSTSSYIEDPVGAYQFSKNEQGMFWDAFIGQNNISFEIKRDYFLKNSILRDADVVTFNPTSNTTVITPAFLRYSTEWENNQLKVKSLEAYWSFPQVTSATLRRGAEGIKILKTQLSQIKKGLGSKITTKHFAKGLTGGLAGNNQKKFNKFLKTVNGRNLKAWNKIFSADLSVITKEGSYTFNEFFQSSARFINLEKVVFSGKNIVFDCVYQQHGSAKLALAILKFKSNRIFQIEVFE
jgi:hypothetical protein